MNDRKKTDTKQRTLLTAALTLFIWGLICLISGKISPEAGQFTRAANPWVLMGLGIAGYIAYEAQDKA